MWMGRTALTALTLLAARPPTEPRTALLSMQHPARLTKQITATVDMRSLLALQEQSSEHFNSMHLGAYWSQLGRLARSSRSQRAWLLANAHQLESSKALTARLLPSCSSRTIANVAKGLAMAVPGESELWRQLVRAAQPELSRMKAMELATLSHAVALAGCDSPALFDDLAVEALPRLSEFTVPELSALAWAFARSDSLGLVRQDGGGWASPPSPRHRRLRERLGVESGASGSASLGDALSSAAAREVRAAVTRSLLEGVAEAAVRRRDEISPREIANLAWAFGRLNVPAPALLDVLVARALPRLEEFTPQGLANTAWGLARAAHDAPDAFDAIGDEVSRRLDSRQSARSAAASATAAAAYATAAAATSSKGTTDTTGTTGTTGTASGSQAQKLVAAAAAVEAEAATPFNPQELSQLAWAFAAARRFPPRLFQLLSREVAARAGELAPQGLSNCAWAFATAAAHAGAARPPAPGSSGARAFDALVEASLGKLEAFKPQELANLAWAVASAGYVSPRLFDPLIVQAQRRLDERGHLLSRGLGGGGGGGGAADVAADAKVSRHDRLNAQDIATTAWAFATARAAEPQAFADHFGWRLLQTPYWEWDALAHTPAELRARSTNLTSALADALELAPRRRPSTPSKRAAGAPWRGGGRRRGGGGTRGRGAGSGGAGGGRARGGGRGGRGGRARHVKGERD